MWILLVVFVLLIFGGYLMMSKSKIPVDLTEPRTGTTISSPTDNNGSSGDGGNTVVDTTDSAGPTEV